jgi:hypothetical protein
MMGLISSLSKVARADLPLDLNLQTRTDRKYLISSSELEDVIRPASLDLKVVTDGSNLISAYESVYFDTPDFQLHKLAAVGRRRRFKVRTRSYLDSRLSFFELKIRSSRSQTKKVRIEIPFENRTTTPQDQTGWIHEELQVLKLSTPEHFVSALKVDFERITLISITEASRITIDSSIQFNGVPALNNQDWLIVETKSTGRPSQIDRLLWNSGFRPLRISKYGVGISLLNIDAPRNKWNRAINLAFKGGEFDIENSKRQQST